MHVVHDNAYILLLRFAKVLLSSYPTGMVCRRFLLRSLTLWFAVGFCCVL